MMENLKNNSEIQDIFNITNDAITIHDRDFNIIHANTAAEKILGLKQNTLLSQKCYKSYHGTDCPPENCPSCLAIKTFSPTASEMFEPNLNRYIEIRAFPSFSTHRACPYREGHIQTEKVGGGTKRYNKKFRNKNRGASGKRHSL